MAPTPEDEAAWAEVLAHRPDLAPTLHGRLNPAFVEWLMGFPLGWTELDGATRKMRLEALGDAVVPLQARVALALLQGECSSDA